MSGSGIVPAALAAVVAAGVLGAWVMVVLRRRRSAATAGPGPLGAVALGRGVDGRALDAATVPDVRPCGPTRVLPADLAAPPGTVLLLQISARYCADSRAARAVLADVAAGATGTVVREIDIDHRPELVGRLALRSTPTTVLYDGAGTERSRLTGVPRRAVLLDALAAARDPGPGGGRRAC